MNYRKQNWDDRRDIVIVDNDHFFKFCVDHWISAAQHAISDQGYFNVALSGGSTPKKIFSLLALPENASRIDWNYVRLFWGDERAVSPTNKESNYRMAMDAGFGHLPILKENIFRMVAEIDIEKNARAYEQILLNKIPDGRFDLVMLGMGEDGHTASLFPRTHGLHSNQALVVANYINEKKIWRMSLTFECINKSKMVAIYVTGKEKALVLKRVLESPYYPDDLPAQRLGTLERHALWIVDSDAVHELSIEKV